MGMQIWLLGGVVHGANGVPDISNEVRADTCIYPLRVLLSIEIKDPVGLVTEHHKLFRCIFVA